VYWAHTNGNVLYTVSNGGTGNPAPAIWKTTFTSPTVFTQLKVLDPTLPGGPCSALIPAGTYTGGSISVSADDNILYGAIVTNQQNSPGYVFAYNQNTAQCSAVWTGAATNLNNVLFFDGTLHNATLPCTPIGLHNSNIFRNGTYSRMTTGAITGGCTNVPLIWQVGTSNVYTCATNPSGHSTHGYNLEVVISNPTYFFSDVTAGSTAYCAGLLTNIYGSGLNLQNGQTGDIENHFTANHLSPAETEPIIVGTAAANNTGTTWVAPTVNEMWAFQRSPFKIQRFTHLFLSSSVTCPSCDFRDVNGIITQSQTGKFGAFCSDMVNGLGNSSNGQRIDAFIVRLD
jgi:hypothetical protein